MGQQLRLCTSIAGGTGSIPGWGTKIWTQREKKSWLSRKGKTEFQRAFTKGQGHLVSDKTAKPMVSHHYYIPSFFGFLCVCVDHFLRSFLNLLQYCFCLKLCFFFWGGGCCEACGILDPQPGSNPHSLHWKHSLNHWTTREVPHIPSLKVYFNFCMLHVPSVIILTTIIKTENTAYCTSQIGMCHPLLRGFWNTRLKSFEPSNFKCLRIVQIDLTWKYMCIWELEWLARYLTNEMYRITAFYFYPGDMQMNKST